MREDTRTRIQEIALKLFTEHGYEATSLREIAEELGVTKAALYYHFKTKEEIVGSLAEMRVREIQELLDWLRAQPKSDQTRRELVHRYAAQLDRSRHQEITKFMERNQTALRDHPTLLRMRELMLELSEELSEAGDPPALRLRRSMALFTLHAGIWILQSHDLSVEERRAVALETALEIMEGRPSAG